jgi:hypothetical protein
MVNKIKTIKMINKIKIKIKISILISISKFKILKLEFQLKYLKIGDFILIIIKHN